MKAKKFKIEDALNATRAAVEEGIIPGGGVALARIAPQLDAFGQELNDAQKLGVRIIRRALEMPLKQIAANSGIEVTGILARIQDGSSSTQGFDFSTGQEVDMIQAGIVDPLKVTRLALENAVSIASTLVTTESIIVDKPEPKTSDAGMGAGGMPGMGGMGY